jgi:hypothetical protein
MLGAMANMPRVGAKYAYYTYRDNHENISHFRGPGQTGSFTLFTPVALSRRLDCRLRHPASSATSTAPSPASTATGRRGTTGCCATAGTLAAPG